MDWKEVLWLFQSRKSPAETPLRFPLIFDQTMTSWSGFGYGMGERRVAWTTLKMAVFAPIPRMSARRATDVKPGFLPSNRSPKRTLRPKFAMLVPHAREMTTRWNA